MTKLAGGILQSQIIRQSANWNTIFFYRKLAGLEYRHGTCFLISEKKNSQPSAGSFRLFLLQNGATYAN